MDNQPEALRLAEMLSKVSIPNGTNLRAAAELRRLHQANQELVEALEFVMTAHGEQLDLAFEQAQALIAKHKEQA